MNKLSLIVDGNYLAKEIKIPEDRATNSYIEDVVNNFLRASDINGQDFEAMFFTDEIGSAFIYEKGDEGIVSGRPIPVNRIWSKEIKYCNRHPKLIEMHNTTTTTAMSYDEIELLKVHSEMYEFLPINSVEKVKAFLKFVINDLNINYHPDDAFEDYLFDDCIIDKNGNKILFDECSIQFMNDLNTVCFQIVGDQFYDLGFDIMQDKLAVQGINIGGDVEQQQFQTNSVIPYTIEDIKNFVAKNSYFEFDDEDEELAEVNFITRMNGNVGDETPGRADMTAGQELCNKLKDKFPSLGAGIETVDEWTNVKCVLPIFPTETKNKQQAKIQQDIHKTGFDKDLIQIFIELKASYNAFQSLWYELNIEAYKMLFEEHYPLFKSFDDYKIEQWCDGVVFKYYNWKPLNDNSTISMAFQNFVIGLEELKEYIASSEGSTKKVLNDLITIQNVYPFDIPFDELVAKLREFNDEVQKEIQDAGDIFDEGNVPQPSIQQQIQQQAIIDENPVDASWVSVDSVTSKREIKQDYREKFYKNSKNSGDQEKAKILNSILGYNQVLWYKLVKAEEILYWLNPVQTELKSKFENEKKGYVGKFSGDLEVVYRGSVEIDGVTYYRDYTKYISTAGFW